MEFTGKPVQGLQASHSFLCGHCYLGEKEWEAERVLVSEP